MMRRIARHTARLAACFVVLGAGTPPAATLSPVDEAAEDPSFFAFRAELIEAAVNRDVETVIAALLPEVRSSFGGNDGVDEFVDFYQLADPESEFWVEFAWALANGGAFQGDHEYFEAPYWSALWPEDVDPFEYVLICGSDVPAFAPDVPDGAPEETLSQEIVQWIEDMPDESWTRVGLEDGRELLVETRWVASPVGYRAGFVKLDGVWWLTHFVAGD